MGNRCFRGEQIQSATIATYPDAVAAVLENRVYAVVAYTVRSGTMLEVRNGILIQAFGVSKKRPAPWYL